VGIEKANGDFEIAFVPTGSYILSAQAWLPGTLQPGREPMDWRVLRATMPLDVGSGDVTGVRIAVNPGPEVEGHLTVEGDAPGSYSVYFHFGKSNLVIKSIRTGQTDVLREGLTATEPGKLSLEIVLAPGGGQIEGAALDKDDKPVAGATVLLVPEPALRRRNDRFFDLTTDQNGHYKFENIPPGDYKVFAWDDIASGSWFDPDFFRAIESHGEPVKLNAKGHETAKVHVY
jgi:hypothetical protein